VKNKKMIKNIDVTDPFWHECSFQIIESLGGLSTSTIKTILQSDDVELLALVKSKADPKKELFVDLSDITREEGIYNLRYLINGIATMIGITRKGIKGKYHMCYMDKYECVCCNKVFFIDWKFTGGNDIVCPYCTSPFVQPIR